MVHLSCNITVAITDRQRRINSVPALTSPKCPTRLFTILEAAEALRVPISWLHERTGRIAIPCRRIGKYVRLTQQDPIEIIASIEANQGGQQQGLKTVPSGQAAWCHHPGRQNYYLKYRTPDAKQKWERGLGMVNEFPCRSRIRFVPGRGVHRLKARRDPLRTSACCSRSPSNRRHVTGENFTANLEALEVQLREMEYRLQYDKAE